MRELGFVESTYLTAIQHDSSRGGRIHAAKHVEHRGLASSRRPHDDNELTLLYGEVHALYRVNLYITHLICLIHVIKLNERHRTPQQAPCICNFPDEKAVVSIRSKNNTGSAEPCVRPARYPYDLEMPSCTFSVKQALTTNTSTIPPRLPTNKCLTPFHAEFCVYTTA